MNSDQLITVLLAQPKLIERLIGDDSRFSLIDDNNKNTTLMMLDF